MRKGSQRSGFVVFKPGTPATITHYALRITHHASHSLSARTTTSTLSTLWQRFVQSFAVPLLAVFTALVISALVIWVTTGDPSKIFAAYRGLWQGAFGTPRNFSETLQTSTPYVFGGLAVALAFKCGLFNIGVEGQLALGAVCAAFVGYSLRGLP